MTLVLGVTSVRVLVEPEWVATWIHKLRKSGLRFWSYPNYLGGVPRGSLYFGSYFARKVRTPTASSFISFTSVGSDTGYSFCPKGIRRT